LARHRQPDDRARGLFSRGARARGPAGRRFPLRREVPMIAHNRPTIGAAEQDAVARVMASGQLAAAGEVHRLEAEFAATLGLPPECAVATCNGTAALYLALWALEAKDRRVLVPAYSCSALRHSVA